MGLKIAKNLRFCPLCCSPGFVRMRPRLLLKYGLKYGLNSCRFPDGDLFGMPSIHLSSDDHG